MERVRVDSSEEAMHVEFPSFRRPDTHLWKRSNFYPGCFLMLLPRTIWIFFWFGALGVHNFVSYLGQPMDVPLSGWRRTFFNRGYWIICPLILLGFGYRTMRHEYGIQEVDYSKYLGPNWRENKFKGKRVSTIVSNHIAFLEIFLWVSLLTPPAFTPASFVKKFALGDHYCKVLQSIYIDRAASKEVLDGQVKEVCERQKLI
mmetsp:Transcript_34772/g.45750  ORF Transcript_34772/g.45750 Transcript_34772/m.45750 type:complete len:202 (+) Transcript_34772:124-729(+)